jgi:RNA polymerase sigma-70 factor, ECF subfamily
VADAVITMADNPERENAESDLLAFAKRGNLDAFERIVMLHERRVYALALRITGNPEDAKDATQEAFLRLHRSIAQIDSARSAGPWLCRVVVNACRDIGRDRQRSRLVPMEEWAAVTPECSASPESLASDRERERHLQLGLRQLPEKERAALLLREMEGLSTEEVARVLGSSAATVRSQICMARLKLRKFFARRFGDHKLGKHS